MQRRPRCRPLARALGQPYAGGSRLDGDDLPGDCALEVDVVACPLEQVAAALRAVEKPWTALRRAGADPDQQAELLTVERLAQLVERLDGAPLVADGADGLGAARRLDDRPRVVEPARDRLLEIDVYALLERRDGHLSMRPRRACRRTRRPETRARSALAIRCRRTQARRAHARARGRGRRRRRARPRRICRVARRGRSRSSRHRSSRPALARAYSSSSDRTLRFTWKGSWTTRERALCAALDRDGRPSRGTPRAPNVDGGGDSTRLTRFVRTGIDGALRGGAGGGR